MAPSRFQHTPAATLGVALVMTITTACGGASEGGKNDASDSMNGDTSISSTAPAPAPATMRESIERRLATELDDPAVAATITAALDDTTVSSYEALIGIDGAATSDALRYVPTRVPDDDIDALVVFAFGNRPGATADQTLPGPVNAEMAAAIEQFRATHDVPVYAQWEVADELAALGATSVTSIGAVTRPDGTVEYLSTAGVAEQAAQLLGASGIDLQRVGIVCFADHAVRCAMTTAAANMSGGVPESLELPATYDPESAQPWTRDRASYVGTDLFARLALLQPR